MPNVVNKVGNEKDRMYVDLNTTLEVESLFPLDSRLKKKAKSQ